MRFVSTLIAAAAGLALCVGAAQAGTSNSTRGAHPAAPYVKQVGAKTPAAAAPNVLYYVDLVLGSDTFATALANLGLSATQTNDPVQFDTLLSGGGWDLVIVQQNDFCQASFFGASLASYIANGGKAIGADWCAGNGDTTISSAFSAQASGSIDAGSIAPGSGALWAGINDPFTLSNPGWGIYSVGLAPLGSATGTGTYDIGGSAVIVGNDGRTYMNGTLEDSYADTSQAVLFNQNEINAALGGGGGGSDITGTIAGTAKRVRVVCLNITTRKTTAFMSKDGTFDCGAHGLKISAGDKVSVTLVGSAK